MNERDKAILIERTYERIKVFGIQPQALGWGDDWRRAVRFKVASDIGMLQYKTILDLGCGFGYFYDYLYNRGLSVRYTGFDIVPRMIDAARERHPTLSFRLIDILNDDVSETFDYVIMIGIFNERLVHENHAVHVRTMLKKATELATIGVFADFKDYRSDICFPATTFHIRPWRVVRYCKRLGGKVILHQHLPDEFAVYLYKA